MTTPAILAADPDRDYWFVEGCTINERLNAPLDPDCSIAEARVPAGGTTRWHRLRDTTERYVVLRGRGRVEVGDLSPAEVGPGDVVLIPPGCRQRIANTGAGELVLLAICTPRFTAAAYESLEDSPSPGL